MVRSLPLNNCCRSTVSRGWWPPLPAVFQGSSRFVTPLPDILGYRYRIAREQTFTQGLEDYNFSHRLDHLFTTH
jgi:hypothetical protein